MAAKTIWWKAGDNQHVDPYKPRSRKEHLCPVCSQAFGVHGKIGDTLVHPGDTIIVHDGGELEVQRPDWTKGVSQ